MKIIFSPTKKMKRNREDKAVPFEYPDTTNAIIDALKSLDEKEVQKLFKISNSLLIETMAYLADLGYGPYTPALFSYEGIQYQYLDPSSLDEGSLDYLAKRMYIVSALYGLLHIYDGIEPYRLDLENPLKVNGCRTLYELWGDALYKELYKDGDTVINLCSEEYSKIITRFLKPGDRFIDIVFYEKEGNYYKEKGVYCKMARGMFLRYMAEHKIDSVEGLKLFAAAGYRYQEGMSSKNKLVFAR